MNWAIVCPEIKYSDTMNHFVRRNRTEVFDLIRFLILILCVLKYELVLLKIQRFALTLSAPVDFLTAVF